ncbi:MAG: hypothetical protein AAGI38_16025 [Bacteroidota bacterium]
MVNSRTIFTLLILVISGVNTGCKRDYFTSIEGVEIEGILAYDEAGSAPTEFLQEDILLGANFEMSRTSVDLFQRVDELTILNPVVEEQIQLTSNRDFFTATDTILAGENLVEYFSFVQLQRAFMLFCNFRANAEFLNESGYYWMYAEFGLSDQINVSDSCLVKINF